VHKEVNEAVVSEICDSRCGCGNLRWIPLRVGRKPGGIRYWPFVLRSQAVEFFIDNPEVYRSQLRIIGSAAPGEVG
jgi:hypothetical protein